MTLALEQPQTRFRHEALLYAGNREFVRRVGAFVRDAVSMDEPILVVVSAEKIAALRELLGRDAEHVHFEDMADVGRNPACIIPAWREFVDAQSSRSSGFFRGVGEPIWAGRTADQLVECQLEDALLNVAFGDGPPWWLMCAYDVKSLPREVILEASRSHAGVSRVRAAPLVEPEVVVDAFVVDIDHLDATRRRVAAHALDFGMGSDRVDDFVLAVSEVATNSLRYGGGYGVARVWVSDDDFCFDIRDEGHLSTRFAGRVRPIPGQPKGYGLWLANQICDLVQIRTTAEGTVVRLHMSR